nr:DNA replication complex GINS protein SLD5-like [Ipomoea batatas]
MLELSSFDLHKLKSMCLTSKEVMNFGSVYLNKNKNLVKVEDVAAKHFEQSVLSKLPTGFKSHFKQSSLSEEDDMGPWSSYRLIQVCKTSFPN